MQSESDATLGALKQQIGDATQCTKQLVQAIANTREQAQATSHIATIGATSVAQANVGLEQLPQDLQNKLQ